MPKQLKGISRWFMLASAIFILSPLVAQAGDTASTTIWGGALYQVGHLEAATGSNYEAVVTYPSSADGFIALTTNDSGMEVWNSDALGKNWTRVETDEFSGCMQPGRHSAITFAGEQYFSATCEDGARIYHVAGLNDFELIHLRTSNAPTDAPIGNAVSGYPTASVIGEHFYMFYNGAYTRCTADACTDVTGAPGQANGVPLEASAAVDDVVYLAFTSGEVMTFNGTSYAIIGQNYLESGDEVGTNIPAIGVAGDEIYVGNMDTTNGASIFQYDPTDANANDELWEEVMQLDEADELVNKMQTITLNGAEILPFYTGNTTTGTNIFMIDDAGNLVNLVEAGLGGTNPENNAEVVSIAIRTVTDRGQNKKIQLFATQNRTDQTKIFVLDLGTDVPIVLDADNLVEPDTAVSAAALSHRAMVASTSSLTRGQALRVRVPRSQLQTGDRVTLYVNGETIQTKTARAGRRVLFTYDEAATARVGTNFRVRVGIKRSYGAGSNRQVSTNIVTGNILRVRITRATN